MDNAMVGFLEQTQELEQDFDIRNKNFIAIHHSVLTPYLLAAEQFTQINSVTGRFILTELSKGVRMAGEFKAKALYNYNTAKTNRKRAEAVAALDLFPVYVSSGDKIVKPTDAARSYYVDMHPSVVEAKEQEAFAEALLTKITDDWYHIYNAWKMAANLSYGKQQGELSEIPDGILKTEDNQETSRS